MKSESAGKLTAFQGIYVYMCLLGVPCVSGADIAIDRVLQSCLEQKTQI